MRTPIVGISLPSLAAYVIAPMTAEAMALPMVAAGVCAALWITYPHVTYEKIHQAVLTLVFLIACWELASNRLRRRLPRSTAVLPVDDAYVWKMGLLLCVSLLVHVTILVEMWVKGVGGGLYVIGGLLPYSDSAAYHAGAQGFVEFGVLDPFNSSRRPLPILLYATLLKLFGQNLQATLMTATILLALSSFFAARAACQSVGLTAGLIMVILLAHLIAPSIGAFMTEVPGMIFGNLGFAGLWHGARRRGATSFVVGLVMLCLGLSMRAGAFFIIPLAVFCAGYLFGERGRINWRVGGVCLVAAIVALGSSWGMARLLGDTSEKALFANAPSSLYGIATGNKGYTQAYRENPRLSHLSETEQAKEIMRLFVRQVATHPGLFVASCAKTLITNLRRPGVFLFPSFITLPRPGLTFLLLAACVAWVLFRQFIGREAIGLMASCMAGIFLSSPFLVDASHRAYAATWVFNSAVVAVGIGAAICRLGAAPASASTRRQENSDNATCIVSMLLMAILFAGPLMVRASSPKPAFEKIPDPGLAFPIIIRSSRGSTIHLVDSATVVPEVSWKSYLRNNPTRWRGNPAFLKVRVGQYLWEGCDLLRRLTYHIAFDEDIGGYNGNLLLVSCSVIGATPTHVLVHGKVVRVLGKTL